MAQRTGADGFIASWVKAASARIFLALAVVATLSVSGCGGRSDDASTASGLGPEATGSTQETATTTSQERASKPPASSSGSRGNDAKAKHGPQITPPKGSEEPKITPTQQANATVANISLESPALGVAVGSTQSLPAKYTCDGEDSWPELRWSGIPVDTKELVLFTMSLEPVNEAIFFDWAVAGMDPSLEGIEEGRLPEGAILGKNSFGKNGYSICPQGEGETYVFALYALPSSLHPSKDFDPNPLRKEVLDISGNAGLLAVSFVRG
jgi:phosphatidylethanolamine-binding protein (PEBP) family uncharacterized protein